MAAGRSYSDESGKLRLLIVDESAVSREALARVLSMRGYDCQVAGTVGDALRAASACPPEVVILDWVFRDASGIGLAQKLRDVTKASIDRLQVVALSVWEEPFGVSVREGIDLYYVKPASLVEIDGAIRARIGGARRD